MDPQKRALVWYTALDSWGAVAKWPKAAVCKTAIRRFESARRLCFFALLALELCWPTFSVCPVFGVAVGRFGVSVGIASTRNGISLREG